MKRFTVVVLLGMMVSGCVSTPNSLLADSICRSAATALNTLGALYSAGHLSEGDAQFVDHLDVVLRPLCTGPDRPTSETALNSLNDTVMQLLLMQGRYEQ